MSAQQPLAPAPLTPAAPRLRSPRAAALLLVIGTLAVGGAGLVAALIAQGPLVWGAAVSATFMVPAAEQLVLAPLPERSEVLAADGTVLATLHGEVNRRVVPLEAVAEHVRQAVLTAEDRRFFEHHGYDAEGIARALVTNLRSGSVREGGSTITQQLAKNNFAGSERSLDRKVVELLYAVALEERFTKEALLERYLNEVYFGSGAYGIMAAAEEFFRAEPDTLTIEQAATLAGMIRAPDALNPRRNPVQALARRNAVLRGMVAEGYVSAADRDHHLSVPLEVAPRLVRTVEHPFVIEAVKREVFANPALGETREARIDALFTGGLQIHTSIDPRLQAAAADAIAEQLLDPAGPTAAIAAVDPWTGQVRALYAGMEFAEEQFDLTTQGRRQPGSAFKPFVMAAALERGFPLTTRLPGGATVFDIPGHLEPWSVSNYGGARYGELTMTEALTRSVNTAFAQLMLTVGPEAVADLSARLGIDIERATAGHIVPAMALGGFDRGVTPLEMASAYGVFATGGIRAEPALIDRVLDHAGASLYTREITRRPVLHETVAATMIDALGEVVARGTGTRAQLEGWDVAGKTGTTQRNADAWFVGFTPVLSTAVWVGHPHELTPMPGIVGGQAPATLWHAFMQRAHEGRAPIPFREMRRDVEVLRADREVEIPDPAASQEPR